MLQVSQIEELISLAEGLDRAALIRQLTSCPAPFPVDFTADFLGGLPLERLRHLFVALHLHLRQMPQDAPAPSAA